MSKYRQLGASLDRTYMNDLNSNFDDVDKDIKAIDNKASDAINTANTAATNASAAKKEAGEAKTSANQTKEQMNNIIIENGNSNPEIVAMRTDKNGKTFSTAGDRLDNVDTQLADITIQVDSFQGTDDEKLLKAINAAKGIGAKISFSNKKKYTFNNDYLIDFPLILEGTFGVFTNETILEYKGQGTFLKFKWDTTKKGYGFHIKNLTIHGNPNAVCGIRVNEYNDVATGTRGFTLENVTVKRFVNGWGVDLCNAYGNTFLNCTIIQNGANVRLKNAHSTSIFGGAIEGSIFGISIEGTRPVNFYGVAIEGYVFEQIEELNGSIPADLLVWDGWTQKTGGSYLPVTWQRLTRNDYVGTGVRNLNSIVNFHGCYFELNRYSILNELEAVTNVYGGWVEVVQRDRCFADIGHGRFTLTDSNIKIDTIDPEMKVINFSNLRCDHIKVLDNKITDFTRMFGGHLNYKGIITNNSNEILYKEKVINSDTTIKTKNLTTTISSYDFKDHYSASIQNVEKIMDENIYITATNAYVTLNFNPINNPVIEEGSKKTVVFKAGATASRVTFGLNFSNIQNDYILVLPNEVVSAQFVYVGGKLFCTSYRKN